MPELPEVETVRRGLEPAMKNKHIVRVLLNRDGLRTPFAPGLAERIEGGLVTALTRRAKYILIHLGAKNERRDILVLHLGMSGRVTIQPSWSVSIAQKHDHFVLMIEDGRAVVLNDARRFGQAFVVSPDDMESHPAFRLLGPEPLENDFDASCLFNRIKGKKSPIKNLLMDQRVVAGIGNIYACEALYEACIDPDRIGASIKLEEAARLVLALKKVLNLAIAAGGSSLKDHRQADGEMGYFQHNFAVYGRTGKACPRFAANGKTAHIVVKAVQAGRSTFFCPGCQK